jgi:hypothetical protein
MHQATGGTRTQRFSLAVPERSKTSNSNLSKPMRPKVKPADSHATAVIMHAEAPCMAAAVFT